MAYKRKGQPTIREILDKMLDEGELDRIMTENNYLFVSDLVKHLEANKIASNERFRTWQKNLGKERSEKLMKLSTRAYETQAKVIVSAMKRNAEGFEYEETEQEYIYNPETGEEVPGRRRVFKRYKAPDIQSQKILMTNITKKLTAIEDQSQSEIQGWTNSPEIIEVKADGSLDLTLDKAVQEILKEINNDR